MAELVPITTASLLLGALALLAAARRSTLRRLRVEVDARLIRLEERLERLERPISAARPKPAPKPVPAARNRVDPPAPAAAPGPTLIEVPSLVAGGSDAAAAAAASELAARFGAVWSLADSGATVDSIARATGQGVGQVELILGLRRGGRPPEAARTVRGEAEHES